MIIRQKLLYSLEDGASSHTTDDYIVEALDCGFE